MRGAFVSLLKPDLQQTDLKLRRSIAALFAPYAAIWGVQWAMNAFLQYIWLWPYQNWVLPATVIPSLAATLWVWNRQLRQTATTVPSFHIAVIVLVVIMISGMMILLQAIRAIELFFAPIFHTSLLSILYVFFGGWLDRRYGISFLCLGVWLFSLTIIIGIWFPGFAPVVLGFFGGLSLIASSWIIARSSR